MLLFLIVSFYIRTVSSLLHWHFITLFTMSETQNFSSKMNFDNWYGLPAHKWPHIPYKTKLDWNMCGQINQLGIQVKECWIFTKQNLTSTYMYCCSSSSFWSVVTDFNSHASLVNCLSRYELVMRERTTRRISESVLPSTTSITHKTIKNNVSTPMWTFRLLSQYHN